MKVNAAHSAQNTHLNHEGEQLQSFARSTQEAQQWVVQEYSEQTARNGKLINEMDEIDTERMHIAEVSNKLVQELTTAEITAGLSELDCESRVEKQEAELTQRRAEVMSIEEKLKQIELDDGAAKASLLATVELRTTEMNRYKEECHQLENSHNPDGSRKDSLISVALARKLCDEARQNEHDSLAAKLNKEREKFELASDRVVLDLKAITAERDQVIDDDQTCIEQLTAMCEKLKTKLKAVKSKNATFDEGTKIPREDEYAADDEDAPYEPTPRKSTKNESSGTVVCGLCGDPWPGSAKECPNCKSKCLIVAFGDDEEGAGDRARELATKTNRMLRKGWPWVRGRTKGSTRCLQHFNPRG